MIESKSFESTSDRNLEMPAWAADARARRFRTLCTRILWTALATASVGLACVAAHGESAHHLDHPIAFGGLLVLGVAAALFAVRGDLEEPRR